MITKILACRLFNGFAIQRWNDHIRPFDLNEMDRMGHKMTIAYILGKYEELEGKVVDWEYIILGGLFELLKKIALSDIKVNVHRKIKNEYPEEFSKLNEWVVEQYSTIIDDEALLDKFRTFLHEKDNDQNLSKRILQASHRYSAYRELELIKVFNETPFIRNTEKEVSQDLEIFLDLKGLKIIMSKYEIFDFLCLVEQLRNQIRWGQTPRIPRTSVLGHSALVASFSVFFSRELNVCKKRLYNNFFGGLFHDLPEAVTRDIISPVKSATSELSNIIQKIEHEIVREKILPLLDSSFINEIMYFTNDEFENKIVLNDKIKSKLSIEQLNNEYNMDAFSPYDGKIIKLCDEMAAFLEAYHSQLYGINTPHIQEGYQHILTKHKKNNNYYGINSIKFLEVSS